jgi:hypothetical protein
VRVAVAVLCLIALPASTARATPPTFDQLAAALRLGDVAIADLRAGKSYDRFPHELSERDLAAGIVFMSQKTAKDAAELFFRWADISANPNVRVSHALGTEEDLATFGLGPEREDECKKLLAAKPGEPLNLSGDEIATLHGVPAGSSCDVVEGALRKILWGRFTAYRERGLAGIAPYARAGGKQVRGGEELGRVSKSFDAIEPYTRTFRAVLDDYPTRPPSTKESFRWIVYEDDKRPRVTLRHRVMVSYEDGNYGFSDREFYVTQGYNTTQGLAGTFAVDGGSLFIYRANTSTDRVEGSASSMKHSIGRKMMAKQLETIFKRFRARLDK